MTGAGQLVVTGGTTGGMIGSTGAGQLVVTGGITGGMIGSTGAGRNGGVVIVVGAGGVGVPPGPVVTAFFSVEGCPMMNEPGDL